MTETFSSNSEYHRKLAEVVSQATSHAPSMQLSRKTPQGEVQLPESMMWQTSEL